MNTPESSAINLMPGGTVTVQAASPVITTTISSTPKVHLRLKEHVPFVQLQHGEFRLSCARGETIELSREEADAVLASDMFDEVSAPDALALTEPLT